MRDALPTGINFKKSNIRIWIHQRNLTNLQQVVWEGHGSKLLVEHSNNPKIKKFLEAVPHIMGLIKEIHIDTQNGDLEGLKNHLTPPVPPMVLSGKDSNGLTALHKAVGLGKEEIAEYIVKEYPTCINAVDNEGRTPLHYAALLKDDGKMTNFLIEHGADESALDHKQKTAAYYKTRHSELDSKLLNVIPECPRSAKESFAASFDWSMLTSSLPLNGIKEVIYKAEKLIDRTTNDTQQEADNVPENGNDEQHYNNKEDEVHTEDKEADNTENGNHDTTTVDESNPDGDEKQEENENPQEESEQDIQNNNNDVDNPEQEKYDVDEPFNHEAKQTEEIPKNDNTEENNNNAEMESNENRIEIENENNQKDKADGNEFSEPGNEKTSNEDEPTIDQESTKSRPTSVINSNTRPNSQIVEKSRPTSQNQENSRPSSRINSETRPSTRVANDDEHQYESDKTPEPVFEGEGIIEGVVNGEDEVETLNNEGQNQRHASSLESVEGIKALVDAGNMEQLAALVLNGEGERLVGQKSDNPELQSFLENVPVYMSKINRIHEAARNGSLRDLQAALDRRKFAIAKDSISPNGASPLHVAVIFGNTSIVRYLAGRFPETVQVVDNDGRTPLHYAAVLSDNGHYYNLLIHLGADTRIEDKFGHTPEYYRKNQSDFSHKSVLKEFGAEEQIADEILSDKVPADTVSARKDLDDEDMLAVLERCYNVLHGRRNSNISASSAGTTISTNNSSPILNKHMRRYVFDKVKYRVTKLDHNLYDVIWPSVKKLPTDVSFRIALEQDFPIGIVAPDFYVYKVFREFFEPIIKEYNAIDLHYELQTHPKGFGEKASDTDSGSKVVDIEMDLDPNMKWIISVLELCPTYVKLQFNMLKETSALAQHSTLLGHNMSFDGAEILMVESNYNKRCFLEMVCINNEEFSMNKRSDIENLIGKRQTTYLTKQ
ncbi:hypothetical protein NQ315_015140 [Exocentrus adspersus]|uniref:Phosphagen kinase N-terminal domain-containing protein n=1 Tax=Exocentrus adspersus TaxID=1586481 RepID=A0AAV8VEM9_9CUCU|nr:hypothetical protein NQ315_015140 [Exocentrus adspersus]